MIISNRVLLSIVPLLLLVGCGDPNPGGGTDSAGGAAADQSSGDRPRLAYVTNGVADFWTIAKAGADTAGVDFDADAFEHALGNIVAPFIGLPLEDLRSGRLFWDLARVAAEHGAPLPLELVIFIKTQKNSIATVAF